MLCQGAISILAARVWIGVDDAEDHKETTATASQTDSPAQERHGNSPSSCSQPKFLKRSRRLLDLLAHINHRQEFRWDSAPPTGQSMWGTPAARTSQAAWTAGSLGHRGTSPLLRIPGAKARNTSIDVLSVSPSSVNTYGPATRPPGPCGGSLHQRLYRKRWPATCAHGPLGRTRR